MFTIDITLCGGYHEGPINSAPHACVHGMYRETLTFTVFCASFNDRVTFLKIATKSRTPHKRALFAPSINYSTTDTGHSRSRHVPATANEPLQDEKKSESTFLFQCPTPPPPPHPTISERALLFGRLPGFAPLYF
jgi:hypothetical protein